MHVSRQIFLFKFNRSPTERGSPSNHAENYMLSLSYLFVCHGTISINRSSICDNYK